MKPEEFMRRCKAYYGGWQYPAVESNVRGYVNVRNGAYLDAMWKIMLRIRPAAFKGPDMAALMSAHEEALNLMDMKVAEIEMEQTKVKMLEAPIVLLSSEITLETIKGWPTEEDGAGDGWLSRKDSAAGVAIVFAQLKAKEAEREREMAEARKEREK